MESTRTRTHVRQFPLRKIEALVKLAVDNNLSLLQIGDVKIVPGPIPHNPVDAQRKLVEEIEKKAGRPLSEQELKDEILFGPGGSLKVEDE